MASQHSPPANRSLRPPAERSDRTDFGSFKAAWRRRSFEALDLQGDLDLFRTWYNHPRPHENLSGRTPAMAWDGVERCRGKPWLFEACDGELVGYALPTR